jgi:pimeloyl-ACP methyl ester carboxylesterase
MTAPTQEAPKAAKTGIQVLHRTVHANGVQLFYREAGNKKNPTLLLLHGFPASSHMFRRLIPLLADKYHVLAPDYPGFGLSEAPDIKSFDYTFDNLAKTVESFIKEVGAERFSLYLMDYGAPIGLRIAIKHPQQVQSLVIQNGNAYLEGVSEAMKPIGAYWENPSAANAAALKGLMTPDGVKFQYTAGTRNPEAISPDNWAVDLHYLARPGNLDIQLALLYDYRNNIALYPQWQECFRKNQPSTLIVWGRNDPFFTVAGAKAYLKDLKKAELHLFDTGHFALEEDCEQIAERTLEFLAREVK